MTAATVAIVLQFSQMCWIESEYSERDCVAEIHVIRKRAGDGDMLAMVHRYSALDRRAKRSRMGRSFPFGDVPGRSARWNTKWALLRGLVAATLAGEVPDPCPAARDWNGPGMPHGPRHVEVCRFKQVYYRVSWLKKGRRDES